MEEFSRNLALLCEYYSFNAEEIAAAAEMDYISTLLTSDDVNFAEILG